jgi:hypothetical protein
MPSERITPRRGAGSVFSSFGLVKAWAVHLARLGSFLWLGGASPKPVLAQPFPRPARAVRRTLPERCDGTRRIDQAMLNPVQVWTMNRVPMMAAASALSIDVNMTLSPYAR